MSSIDTKKAENRRLRFETIAQAKAEVETILASEKAGTCKRTGNWTVGQNFGHLASWIEWGFDGYPPSMGKPPWFVKIMVKFMKKKIFDGPAMLGFRLPHAPEGTFGMEDVPADAAAGRLLTGLSRLEQGSPKDPNPAFGPMTHEEWKKLHLRHCEGHLGFLWPNAK